MNYRNACNPLLQIIHSISVQGWLKCSYVCFSIHKSKPNIYNVIDRQQLMCLSVFLVVYLSILLLVYLSVWVKSVYRSVCTLPAYLFTCKYLLVNVSTCLYVYLSICLLVNVSTCLYIYLSMCLLVNVSTFQCVYYVQLPLAYLSICLYVYLSILYIFLSITLSICLIIQLSICL